MQRRGSNSSRGRGQKQEEEDESFADEEGGCWAVVRCILCQQQIG